MQGEIKPGYKQTEVGVIPEDWDQMAIEELIENGSIRGHLDGNHGALYPRSTEFTNFGVRYVTANDFENGVVNLDGCRCLRFERAALFRKGVSIDGDVLFAHNATVGPVALLRTTERFVILSTTATYFRCDNKKLHNLYLKYALQAPYFVEQYTSIMSQSTRNQVPITAQRKLKLVVPGTSEQRAIAAALADADALIAALEGMIAKKRDLKQAAMQHLLTGKTRLPGFSGAWEVKRLGEVAEIVMGQSPASANYNTAGQGLPLIQGNADIRDRKTIRRVFTKQVTKHGRAGDLLMSVRAPVGEVALATFDCCLGRGVCAIRYPNWFLYHALIAKEPDWAKLSKGSTFDSVNSSEVRAFPLEWPSDPAEQTAIAEVLTDMDADLAALETRAAKARAVKQGMMQELLTGRVRLV